MAQIRTRLVRLAVVALRRRHRAPGSCPPTEPPGSTLAPRAIGRGRGSRGQVRPTTVVVTVVLCAGAIAAALWFGPDDGPQPAVPAGHGRVEQVIDGDTVALRIERTVEHVRLIGIDTPETVHPHRPVECFGPEASARTAELLPEGEVVRVERDVEARDRYGRLLAYLWLPDGRLVAEVLAAEGYAVPLDIPPNSTHRARIAAAAAHARADQLGSWGACPTPSAGR